jgi:hypothetical protein
LDRHSIRRTFERRFTARTMALNYVELYRSHSFSRQRSVAVLTSEARRMRDGAKLLRANGDDRAERSAHPDG